MSSTSTPFGMSPIRHVNGKFLPPPRAIAGGIASAYNANIFLGSPVKLLTTGLLAVAAANEDIVGVFAGCQFVPSATSLLTPQMNWVANATYVAGTMVAYVWDDPGIIFEIQSSGSLAQAATGDQADFVNPGTGNSTTGLSTAQISTTLAGAGAQAQLRIVGLATRIDNEWGDAFTNVEVQIARHQYISNKVAV